MEKYKQKELRELVRLGVAEDYTNKPKGGLFYGRLRYQRRPRRGHRNRHVVRHYRALLQSVYLVLRGVQA